jgi:hypothetical protein
VDGWELVDKMLNDKVPYEMLLQQRLVGGSWGQHRNATSSAAGELVLDEFKSLLRARSISYVGRESRQLQRLSLVGRFADLVITRPSGEATWSVVVSVANDGGTARKTAAKLSAALGGHALTAAILVGPGWVNRLSATAALVEAIGGHVYSDSSLSKLVDTVSISD